MFDDSFFDSSPFADPWEQQRRRMLLQKQREEAKRRREAELRLQRELYERRVRERWKKEQRERLLEEKRRLRQAELLRQAQELRCARAAVGSSGEEAEAASSAATSRLRSSTGAKANTAPRAARGAPLAPTTSTLSPRQDASRRSHTTHSSTTASAVRNPAAPPPTARDQAAASETPADVPPSTRSNPAVQHEQQPAPALPEENPVLSPRAAAAMAAIAEILRDETKQKWCGAYTAIECEEQRPNVQQARAFYEEGLLQLVIKLDAVDTEGHPAVRQARKKAIVDLEQSVAQLKAFAQENDFDTKKSDDAMPEEDNDDISMGDTAESSASEQRVSHKREKEGEGDAWQTVALTAEGKKAEGEKKKKKNATPAINRTCVLGQSELLRNKELSGATSTEPALPTLSKRKKEKEGKKKVK